MGGAPESLFLFCKGLDEEKYEPLVVCSEKNKLTERFERQGIDYEIIRMGMWRKGKNIPLIPISILRLCKLAKSKNVSLIHANSLWDAPYAGWTARFLKIPCVVHIRTEYSVEKAKKYFLNLADSIITISGSLKKTFKEIPEIHKKMTTVYNGIEIESIEAKRLEFKKRITAEKKPFTVGYIGRIDPLKGLVDLLGAFKLLVQSNENTKLVIIGDITGKSSAFYELLKSTAKTLNIDSKIKFTGYQDNVINSLFEFDLLILPSLKEGFGRVLIEAMAARVPVIGTDVGGIPEIIDNGNDGFIVPTNNPEYLKEIIIKIMKDGDLRKNISENGFKKVKEKFSLEQNIQKIIDIYDMLLTH